MPASSEDVIGAVLQAAFKHKPPNYSAATALKAKSQESLEDLLVSSSKQVLLNHVDYDSVGNQQSHMLNSLKTKYVHLSATSPSTSGELDGRNSMAHGPALHKSANYQQGGREDHLEGPRVVLWPRERVVLGWRKTFPPGAGMSNMGNTCYMNSSLQALFHIPSLLNWMLEDSTAHISRCESNNTNMSFCTICALMKTLRSSLDRSNTVIRPVLIHNKLKMIGKTLMYGRQEDAHEFIKLLLDHMEKSYLNFKRATKLDHRSKETTPLNQIFGGYLRQQVICPSCRHVSTTFSHFQDLVLDIRTTNSVDEALNLYFRKETLDADNAYKCEKCHKRVSATKRHLIERAPHVLLIQLKRFTFSGGKIGKHINIQRTIDITRFVNGANKEPQGPEGGPYQYKLVSMVIHLGGSQHGGHYTAVAEASNGTMFEFDDSSVRPISLNSALMRNPYILFYEMIRKPKGAQSVKQVIRQSSEKTLIRQNSDGATKPFPTSYSASSMANGYGKVSSENTTEATNRMAFQNNPTRSPLPSQKERDRIAFGLKTNSGNKIGEPSKPNKIILHNPGTSLLATKSSSSQTTVNNSRPTSSASSRTPSLVPYLDDSDNSDDEKPGQMVNGTKENDDSKIKRDSGAYESVKSRECENVKYKCDSGHVKDGVGKMNGEVVREDSLASSENRAIGSLNGTRCKISSGSNTWNGYRKDVHIVSSGMSCSSHSGSVKFNETAGGKSSGVVHNIKSSGIGANSSQHSSQQQHSKQHGNWVVTEAAGHSASETSSQGSLSNSTFVITERTGGTPPKPKDKPEVHGWAVTPSLKKRPELEKSMSHDSVLPKFGQGLDDDDTASVKSKASVDSTKSDKSTKSVKKSIFSLFTCVGSSRNPDSPEEEKSIFYSCDKSKQKNDGGSSTDISDLCKKISDNGESEKKRSDKNESKHKNGQHPDSDQAKSKRFREQEESEPSSPSKKCRPEDRAKNGHNSDADKSKNGHDMEKSKNGYAERGEKKRKEENINKEKEKKTAETNHETSSSHNDNATSSASATSSSSTSSDSESSDSDSEEGETVCWVERTKEGIGKAKIDPKVSVVPWNASVRDLSDRFNWGEHKYSKFDVNRKKERGMWDGSRNTQTVDDLRRAGNFAYGTKVHTWGGNRSLMDKEFDRDRKEAKKRNIDDLYNESIDAGRKKKKPKKYRIDERDRKDRETSRFFQKVQDMRNSNSDHNRSWDGKQQQQPYHYDRSRHHKMKKHKRKHHKKHKNKNKHHKN
ncbi:ubiquitin specific peptidase 36 [Oratosquilla oratoria]|uniref:ubiquitin specific peptidase 36 n=1 Tax=Oratosquilla oratoria TaxID=337810 RepID=UPI003F769867